MAAVGTTKRTNREPAATNGEAPVVVVGHDIVTQLRIEPGGLDAYLKMVGEDGGNPLLKCYDEWMLLVSPGVPHEKADNRIAVLVLAICAVLRIPCLPLSSTLYRKPDADRGIEPDKSFYVGNFAAVRGRMKLDLSVDPPPDLIFEVVDSHPATISLEVCLDLRVPEVWVYDVPSRQLAFLTLKRAGKTPARYGAAKASLAFPFLSPADVVRWLVDPEDDFGAFDRKLRKWVRRELAPRYAAQKRQKPRS